MKSVKHLFIMNPKAGKYNHANEIIPIVKRCMSGRNEFYKTVLTEYPMHVSQLVQEYAVDGSPLRVYVCGGDGTLNEAAQGAAGLDHVALTHFPCGTGNDFIKIFGQDTSRFFSLDELVDGEIKQINLIECCGRYGINICSVGFDARISADVSRFKHIPFIHGKGSYNLSVIYNLFQGLHHPYKVLLDGKTYDGRYTMLVACNGRFYGGGFNPAPHAIPDDGLIDFLLAGPVTPFTVARVIKKYQNGQYADLPNYITWIRGQNLFIECDKNMPVNIDGETIFTNKINFSISDKKLNFIVPKGAIWSQNTADRPPVLNSSNESL
ncbi:MAG: diacylglycerol kinase family protein [Clostridiales bacterium]|nr:diacylglycerol kinase family protein [Clostridiales bacterium]